MHFVIACHKQLHLCLWSHTAPRINFSLSPVTLFPFSPYVLLTHYSFTIDHFLFSCDLTPICTTNSTHDHRFFLSRVLVLFCISYPAPLCVCRLYISVCHLRVLSSRPYARLSSLYIIFATVFVNYWPARLCVSLPLASLGSPRLLFFYCDFVYDI